MSCYQIVYKSRATCEITPDVLDDILVKSNSKNYRLKISGLLVYKNNHFMQLLEGDEEEVKNLLAVIQGDQRHTDIEIVYTADGVERCMPTWAMGFSMFGFADSVLSNRTFHIPMDKTEELCESMQQDIGLAFSQFFAS